LTNPTRRTLIACAAAACAALSGPALAQAAWPDKPIKVIVPYTPAGATDAVTRMITEKMAQDTKWSFLVDNKAGGGGNIGLDLVAKSKADGYTLGMGQTANLAINPGLLSKMPYDALKDFVPVALVAKQPVLMVVRADSPWKSLADMVSAAKAKPNEVKQALAATGTLGHLAGEMLAHRIGIKVLNVPYKGAAPAITDLIGGQTDYMFATPQAVLGMLKGGKLRALAVTSSSRIAVLPDVPTVAESGYKGFEAQDWKVLVAPVGTSPEIVGKLHAAVEKALAKPATIAQMLQDGSTPMSGSPAQVAQFIKAEHAQWGKVIRDAGITPD
jgi:tripartite-type tricarboxylate transporter receptor subunit TctC